MDLNIQSSQATATKGGGLSDTETRQIFPMQSFQFWFERGYNLLEKQRHEKHTAKSQCIWVGQEEHPLTPVVGIFPPCHFFLQKWYPWLCSLWKHAEQSPSPEAPCHVQYNVNQIICGYISCRCRSRPNDFVNRKLKCCWHLLMARSLQVEAGPIAMPFAMLLRRFLG